MCGIANRFHVFQSRSGIPGWLMELVRNPYIGHFGLIGVLATAQFCTVNGCVSFWISAGHQVRDLGTELLPLYEGSVRVRRFPFDSRNRCPEIAVLPDVPNP